MNFDKIELKIVMDRLKGSVRLEKQIKLKIKDTSKYTNKIFIKIIYK